MDTFLDWLGQYANSSITVAMLVGVIVVTLLGIKLTPIFRKINYLIDDFSGTPSRPGVAARPGVMERLERIEVSLVALDEILTGRSPMFLQINDRLVKTEQRLKRLEGYHKDERQH